MTHDIMNNNLLHSSHLLTMSASSFQFQLRHEQLVSSLQRFGSPFEDQHDLVVLNGRRIVAAEVADCAGKLYDIGNSSMISLF